MGYFAPIRQDEYPATAATQCIAVYIPEGDEYKALLAGFIALLSDVSSYLDPDSAQADGIAATFDEGYAQSNWDGCGILPECENVNSDITIVPINYDSLSAGAMTWTADVNQRSAGTFAFNPANNGVNALFTRFLAPGNWKYRITYKRQTTNGKLTFAMAPDGGGGAFVNDTFELRGTTLNNSVASGTFTIPETDDQKFSIGLTADGTTGATFVIPISMVEMWKVAD